MRIHLRGFEMNYEDTGGTGVPLLLIHGFPFDHTMWAPQLRALAPAVRVIAPDLRGLGESTLPEGGASLDDYADDLRALLDALGVERATVGGLSMGGYITFAFYRKYASRVRGLVLADTRPQPDSPEAKKGRAENIALVQQKGGGALAEKMLPKMLTPKTLASRPEVTEAAMTMMARQPAEGIIAALAAMRDRPDSTPTLVQIKVPTLVAAGAEDTLTPPEDARALQSAIRGAQLMLIPEAAHMSTFERPEVFNRALADFLRGMS